jgi:hypothetical protein
MYIFCSQNHLVTLLQAALETNFDVDDDADESFDDLGKEPLLSSATAPATTPVAASASKPSLTTARSSDSSSDENASHNGGSVRRRFSEGLKSFSFRK